MEEKGGVPEDDQISNFSMFSYNSYPSDGMRRGERINPYVHSFAGILTAMSCNVSPKASRLNSVVVASCAIATAAVLRIHCSPHTASPAESNTDTHELGLIYP